MLEYDIRLIELCIDGLACNLSEQPPYKMYTTRPWSPDIADPFFYDFVTGKVIFSTIVKRRTSGVRRDKSDTQRHIGGRVTALQRRPSPLIG
jgi:hypothetical protein